MHGNSLHLGTLVRRDDTKVGDGLAEVQAIVAHHQTDVHVHKAPVVVGRPVPLVVEPHEDILAVPDTCARVYLLPRMVSGRKPMDLGGIEHLIMPLEARLTRSFDQRSHNYLGYVVQLDGAVDGELRTVAIAITEAAHVKHRTQVGDALSGTGEPVADPDAETADLYKILRLKVLSRGKEPISAPPPWHGAPPDLAVFRERGHRRLAARTYTASCASCVWGCRMPDAGCRMPDAGCRMPVEIIVDHWNPTNKRYRTETFC